MKLSTLLPVLSVLALIFLMPSLASAFSRSIATRVVGAPLDGGLSILAAAGVAYAAKKRHQRKSTN